MLLLLRRPLRDAYVMRIRENSRMTTTQFTRNNDRVEGKGGSYEQKMAPRHGFADHST